MRRHTNEKRRLDPKRGVVDDRCDAVLRRDVRSLFLTDKCEREVDMVRRLGIVALALLLLAMMVACDLSTPGDRALEEYVTPKPHWSTIRCTPEPAWEPPADYNEYQNERDATAP